MEANGNSWVRVILDDRSKKSGIEKEEYISILISSMKKSKEYCIDIFKEDDLKELGLLDSQGMDMYDSLLETPCYVDIRKGYQIRICSNNWYKIKDTISYKLTGGVSLISSHPHHSIRFDLIKVSNKCCIM